MKPKKGDRRLPMCSPVGDFLEFLLRASETCVG